MGLPNTPVIKTIKKHSQRKNTPHALETLLRPLSTEKAGENSKNPGKNSETDRIIKRKNATVYRESKMKLNADDRRNEENDDFFERAGGAGVN